LESKSEAFGEAPKASLLDSYGRTGWPEL